MGWWIPDRIENSFAQIQPEQLKAKGIRLVLADLDNTLTRYQQPDPDDQVKHWRDRLWDAGITLFVVSNGRRPQRAKRFCTELEVPHISHAGKPHRAAFLEANAAVWLSARGDSDAGGPDFHRYLGRP